MLSSALTSPCVPMKRTSGWKPYIEFRTHPLANIMSKFYHILAGRSIFINQYQRLLSMDGRAADALSFELTLID